MRRAPQQRSARENHRCRDQRRKLDAIREERIVTRRRAHERSAEPCERRKPAYRDSESAFPSRSHDVAGHGEESGGGKKAGGHEGRRGQRDFGGGFREYAAFEPGKPGEGDPGRSEKPEAVRVPHFGNRAKAANEPDERNHRGSDQSVASEVQLDRDQRDADREQYQAAHRSLGKMAFQGRAQRSQKKRQCY
jgi:hypothetical protein